MALRIAVDVMGGDLGIDATLPATLAVARRYPDIQFLLYIEAAIELPSIDVSNVSFIPSADSVAMGEAPCYALRHRRDSSMAKMLQAVASKDADGGLSAGNTGALVALGVHYLKTFDGIERPALCQALPAESRRYSGQSYLLDLGANIVCSAQQLEQFAYLGAALHFTLNGGEAPNVGLLNIGMEPLKGPRILQQVAKRLSLSSTLNYCGFIEGNELYRGRVDVVVCDGFSGNVALKASEGAASFMMARLSATFQRHWLGRLLYFMSTPCLREWAQQMNPGIYNGAYLLGLKGAIVKSHGWANSEQFIHALEVLIHYSHCQYVRPMEKALTQLL